MGYAMKWRNFFVSGLCLVTLVACNSEKPETKAPEQAAVGADAGTKQAGEPAFPIQGKAKEVLHGGGFTYVLIAAEKGETWVAVPETTVAVGEACTVAEGQVMQNFPSKTLNRTFAEILFSPGLEGKKAEMGNGSHGGGAPAAPAAGGGFGAAMQQEGGAVGAGETTPGSGKAVVPFVELKIAKATGENAYTVADIFAKAASLNGKKVKIKAQVLKFSPQIMKKNWLHLQDGTGDPLKNTHDLVVTTLDKAEKGDIVTVEGVLAANKDFGSGYQYDVIVENVTITR
ncbi:MAG: DNA-binding protein [Desulfobulbaceae bacterium]|nr:DNA-binding protein [Desulfobulbaceae bacterium]HIJ89246.1 DNA-binding protein [Deltaproteobacteria bacterium]